MTLSPASTHAHAAPSVLLSDATPSLRPDIHRGQVPEGDREARYICGYAAGVLEARTVAMGKQAGVRRKTPVPAQIGIVPKKKRAWAGMPDGQTAEFFSPEEKWPQTRQLTNHAAGERHPRVGRSWQFRHGLALEAASSTTMHSSGEII